MPCVVRLAQYQLLALAQPSIYQTKKEALAGGIRATAGLFSCHFFTGISGGFTGQRPQAPFEGQWVLASVLCSVPPLGNLWPSVPSLVINQWPSLISAFFLVVPSDQLLD